MENTPVQDQEQGREQKGGREAAGTLDQAKDKLGEVRDQAKDKLSEVKEQAKEKLAEQRERLLESSRQLKDKAKEKISDFRAHLPERADEAVHGLGDKLALAAGTLREKAPTEGSMAQTVEKVVSKLESGGRYLTEHGVADIQSDMTAFVKRHPVQALGGAVLFGYLLGSAISRR